MHRTGQGSARVGYAQHVSPEDAPVVLVSSRPGRTNTSHGAASRIRGIVATARAGRRPGAVDADALAVARWLGTDRARWATLTSWAIAACLGDLVRASAPVAATGVFDAWAAGGAVARSVEALDIEAPAVERVVLIVRALLAVPVGASARLVEDDAAVDTALAEWLGIPAIAAATGWNEWQGDAFVAREPFEAWMAALGVRDTCAGTPGAAAHTARAVARVADAGFRVPAPAVPEDGPPSAPSKPARRKRSKG